jgi:hypothetical protein
MKPTRYSLQGKDLRRYPNVICRGLRYEARFPKNGRQIYLGMFNSPEDARIAVLTAQAENLEARAVAYRAEISRLSGEEKA